MAAANAGLAGTGTVDDTGIDVLSGMDPATAVSVRNLSTSANDLLVKVTGLHGTDFMLLETGQSEIFRRGSGGLSAMWCKAVDNSADATISWGVVSVAV